MLFVRLLDKASLCFKRPSGEALATNSTRLMSSADFFCSSMIRATKLSHLLPFPFQSGSNVWLSFLKKTDNVSLNCCASHMCGRASKNDAQINMTLQKYFIRSVIDTDVYTLPVPKTPYMQKEGAN